MDEGGSPDDLENYVKPKTEWKVFFRQAWKNFIPILLFLIAAAGVVAAFIFTIWLSAFHPYWTLAVSVVGGICLYIHVQYRKYRRDVDWQAKIAARESYWEKKWGEENGKED